MSNQPSVDLNIHDVNEAIDQNYGDYTINVAKPGEPEDIASFRYYLRCSIEARAKLSEAFTRLRITPDLTELPEAERPADGIDAIVRVVSDALLALAVTPEDHAKLAAVLGDDITKWAFVLKAYGARYKGDTGKA